MCAKAKEDKEAKAAKKAEKAAKSKSKPKKKPSSSGGDGYNFFLQYGEYILIAAGVLLFGGLVAMGGGLEKFTLTADQINSSSSRAEETIKNSKVTPKEYDPSVVVYPYEAYSELIKTAVKVNAYDTPVRWEQSLFPDRNKRPDVKPLPIENLRAQSCIGAIMYKEISASNNQAAGGMGGGMGAMGGGMGAMGGGMGGGMMGSGGMNGGGRTEGKQWITITGSIPIRKQASIYSDLFSDAQYLDDVRDQPRYVYYELQRGVVGANGSVDWKKVDVIKAMKKENQQWAGVGSDQVGYNYMAPIVANFPPMAMNCPPMISKPFGEEIANLPNIPLNSTEQIAIQADELKEWNQLQEEMNQIDESALLDRDPFADARSGAGGAGMGSGMMGGMSPMGGGMASSMGSGMGSGMGTGMDGGMGSNAWLTNENAINRARMRVKAAVSVDYYLFRYFDFDVEPGVTYQYRVKLILANPNYGVKEEFVENTSTVEQPYIESDFSVASNPVALGADARVFAQNVKAATRPGAEPVITLSSVYFDAESATESISKDLTLKRGQVANFYGQSHNPVNVQGGMSMDDMSAMYGGGGSSSKKGGKKNVKKSVNHISDVTVVDALGGDSISKSELLSPGKVMILEPNGLLQVRELKEDARELGRYDGSQNMMGMGAGGMMM